LKQIFVQIVSTLTKSRMQETCNDLGTFTIPYTISELTIVDALLDVGVSTNVIPTFMYKML